MYAIQFELNKNQIKIILAAKIQITGTLDKHMVSQGAGREIN